MSETDRNRTELFARRNRTVAGQRRAILLPNFANLGSLAEDLIVSNEAVDHGPRSVFDVRSSTPESHPSRKSPDTFTSFQPSVSIHGCKKLHLQNIAAISGDVAARDVKTSG